ncbi:hypothetical protein SI859A1_03703, partial [Aurantimonas manganoxydans SI85-9A1]
DGDAAQHEGEGPRQVEPDAVLAGEDGEEIAEADEVRRHAAGQREIVEGQAEQPQRRDRIEHDEEDHHRRQQREDQRGAVVEQAGKGPPTLLDGGHYRASILELDGRTRKGSASGRSVDLLTARSSRSCRTALLSPCRNRRGSAAGRRRCSPSPPGRRSTGRRAPTS